MFLSSFHLPPSLPREKKGEREEKGKGIWMKEYSSDQGQLLLLFTFSVVSDSLRPYRLQHTRLPCPSSSLRACSNSYPLSWWCHPTFSFSVVPVSSHLQSFPASGSFPMSQPFASSGQSIRVSVSASALPMNIHCWFPLGLTALVFLLFKEYSSSYLKDNIETPRASRESKWSWHHGFHWWRRRKWQPTPWMEEPW